MLDKKHAPQLVVGVVFLMFLLSSVQIPSGIAETIDTTPGKIIVWAISILLFYYVNPVLAVLGLVVAYELIYRSSKKTGTADLDKYYPTEQKKWSPFSPMHQFPYTLEQEMVKKMVPTRNSDEPVNVSFKPILDNTHDAASIANL